MKDGGRLEASGWLQLLHAELRHQTLASCSVRTAQPGKVLYSFGDTPDGLYGLMSGCIRMETIQSSQGPTMLSLFHAGAWLGEVELFSGIGRLTTLTAIRPARYLFLSNAAIEETAREHPEIWRALGHLAAEHVGLAVAALDDLTIRSSWTRLAAVLLRLCGARLESGNDMIAAELDVTQAELAQLTNLSRSIVGEILVEMEQKRLINRSYGRLNILDIESLKAFLDDTEKPGGDGLGLRR